MMTATLKIVDAHVLLGRENHLSLDARDLLQRMDEHGIETAVARPMGADLVTEYVSGNDRILNASPRIRGWSTVNPWAGDKALEELRRCRGRGAVGLFLHPSRQGFMPLEPVLWPVLDQAAEWRWPVMIHTGTYLYSDILGVGEVARRYPESPLIAGFGGFTDMWFELPGVLDQVSNLYLDASMIWGDAILEIVNRCGPHRVLFGSAEPRNRYAAALRALSRLNLEEGPMKQILGDNARKLGLAA